MGFTSGGQLTVKTMVTVVSVAMLFLAVYPTATVAARKRGGRPNLIVVLTDDQDVELGSMLAMPKTRRLLGDGGAQFENAFASTPMCCPSRSSILTGLYTHNHNVWSNKDNCSSLFWRNTHEVRSFGVHLQNGGYRTGYFGKYLNEYRGTYVPPGWTHWMGLVKNSAFYNYTVNVNGDLHAHGADYAKDYFPDLIVNDSVAFFQHSKQRYPSRPVAMVLSMPAPHGPEDSAPQYQHEFINNTAHRTPSWNYAPNPNKPWLFQMTGKMEPIQQRFTDVLQTKRLQTLLSVDDAIEKVHDELDRMGELENTYIVFLSDHGYHLGQFGIAKGKAFPYEFDVKIPFYIRGPGIDAGVRISNIIGNIDVAPTLLDLAGIEVPAYMDGKSIKTLLSPAKNGRADTGSLRKRAWRDTFLLQRGKQRKSKEGAYRLSSESLPLYFTKEGKLMNKCSQNPELYQSPCQTGQKWECKEDATGRVRMRKCRATKPCICPASAPRLREDESEADEDESEANDGVSLGRSSAKSENLRRKGRAAGSREKESRSSTPDQRDFVFSLKELKSGVVKQCSENGRGYVCGKEEKYKDFDDWNKSKLKLDKVVQKYKDHLQAMRTIRKRYKNKFKNIAQILKSFGNGRQSPANAITTKIPATMMTMATTIAPPPVVIPTSIGKTRDGEDCVCDERERDGEDKGKRIGRRSRHRRSSSSPAGTFWSALSLPGEPASSAAFTFEGESTYDSKLYTARGRDRRKERKREKVMRRREDREKRPRKERPEKTKPSRRKDPTCKVTGIECVVMDNHHWKVAPQWTMGPFCFCNNAANNSYFCLRTINATHNFLYCEHTTGFLSYYDISEDPWQLRNAVYDLEYGTLYQLHRTLRNLQNCKGGRECSIRYRGDRDMYS